MVFKDANSIDRDAYRVARLQCELIGRNDAGACHEKYASGKAVVPKQVLNELLRIAFEFC